MNRSVAQYPTLEQWKHIQGGEPLIVSNAASSLFQIVHVYDDKSVEELTNNGELPSFSPELSQKYTHYGCVIDTPRNQFINSASNQEGLILPRGIQVVFPAILDIHRHGNPCASRSKSGGYEGGYSKITSNKNWGNFLERKAEENWIIWAIHRSTPVAKVVNKGKVANYI